MTNGCHPPKRNSAQKSTKKAPASPKSKPAKGSGKS